MFWLAPALAADLSVVSTVTLDAPATAVVSYGSQWLVIGPDGAWEVNSAGPFRVASERLVAAGVADLDADGELDPLLCGRDGLWFSSSAGELWVDGGRCTALAAAEDGWIAIIDGDAGFWTMAAGAPVGPGAAGSGWTDPVLAAGPGEWLIGERGATAATRVSATGSLDVDVGGELSAAVWGDRWWLGLAAGTVSGVGGAAFSADAPRMLAAGDVDGDREDDVVVLSDGVVLAAHQDGTLVSSVTAEATALAVGDADGDGCAEIALLEDAGMTLVILANDACPEDLDGDGWATDDCDDADPAVHPDAEETCDALDNDCDGAVDEDGLSIEAPGTVAEGDTFLVIAGGCGAILTVDPGTEFECTVESASRFRCQAHDDGTMTAEAHVGDAIVSAAIVAENRPPEWLGPTEFAAADEWDLTQWVVDPGDDPLRFAAVSTPPGATLTADGRVLWAWEEGHVVFDVTDDDGASARVDLLFVGTDWDTGGWRDTAWDTGDGGGDSNGATCPACSGLACALPPAVALGLLFRRRRRVI